MDEVLKNRLVGALVIGLALVIFLPLWLDGENAAALGGDAPSARLPELSIPSAPTLEPMDVPPVPSEVTALNQEIDDAHRVDLDQVETQLNEVFAIEDTSPEASTDNTLPNLTEEIKDIARDVTEVATKPAAKPKVTQQTEDSKRKVDAREAVWTIQVASFNESQSTDALKERLRNKNFPTYSRVFSKKDGKKGYRVYVGPILQKQDAERVQQQIHKALSINDTLILRYKT